MSERGADIGEPGAGPGWSVALLIGAATIQFTTLFLLRDHMEPNNWGLLLAIASVSILPLGLALWFGFFRRRNPRGWWKIPLVLWPVSLFGLFTGVAIPEEMPQPGSDEMIYAVPTSQYWLAGVRIAVATAIVAEVPEDESAAPNFGGPSSGDMREIDRIRTAFDRQMREDAQAYEAALVEAGYPGLLLGRNLRSPADLPAARQRLERVLALIDRFRTRYLARIDAVEGQLGRVTPEAARPDLLTGFRAVRAATRDRADQIWRLEWDIAQSQKATLDLLGSTRWRRDGERFVFAASSERARFDALIADVNQARDDQTAWREEIIRTIAGVSTGTIA